jgi:hypothetical protein
MATVLCGTSGYLMAQELVPVTVDNFIRAESDL